MELLSFTYIFIETILVGVAVYGLWESWWILLWALLGLAFYPIVYELLLAIIFRLIFRFRGSKTVDNHRVANPQRTNGLLYHPLYNLGLFSWTQYKGVDLNKPEHTLNAAIDRRPDFDFAFTFRANEPDYPVLYTFMSLWQLIFLNYSAFLSYVFDQPWFWIPGVALRLALLRKFLHQVQGTVNGVRLALEKGAGINLGGGYHHASVHSSNFLNAYNDIGIAIQYLWHFWPDVRNVLVIDVDVHQGNGVATDKKYLMDRQGGGTGQDRALVRKNVFILDMFNPTLPVPNDPAARVLVDVAIEVDGRDSDDTYLNKLQNGLDQVRNRYMPNFIIYNAGTDVLMGDFVGQMGITARGVKMRDEMVFDFAREQRVPVLMLLSGGLSLNAHVAVAESIVNLTEKFPALRYRHNSGGESPVVRQA